MCPDVSIVVPIYNVEKYLSKCINSILEQTYSNFELILVNDGSTDQSLEICNFYKQQDKRIIVINQENKGLSAARNKGIDIAQGKYICFIDSDDYIQENMILTLLELIKQSDADISICNFKMISENNHDYSIPLKKESINEVDLIEFEGEEILNQIYQDYNLQFIVAWNKLYKIDLFNNLRYEYGMLHEDEFIIHRLLYKCKKVIYSSEELYYYLQREGSIMSSNNHLKDIHKLIIFEDRMKFFKKMQNKTLFNKAQDIYLMTIIDYIRKADFGVSLYVAKSIRRNIEVIMLSSHFSCKEKIALIIFSISPKLHETLIKREEGYK